MAVIATQPAELAHNSSSCSDEIQYRNRRRELPDAITRKVPAFVGINIIHAA